MKFEEVGASITSGTGNPRSKMNIVLQPDAAQPVR